MRLFLLIIPALLCAACYYESEESLLSANASQCDTLSLNYSEDIEPVLSSHCYGCHDNTHAGMFGGNIFLENYSDVINRVDDGSLEGSINHQEGFSPMPRRSSKLDSCTLKVVSSWISQGTPEN
ncbi:MAG: hypothetical protein JW801_05880 [Bacteroidales bacterium]|nr:hypothetical protein [Bacteroidales bacterium]